MGARTHQVIPGLCIAHLLPPPVLSESEWAVLHKAWQPAFSPGSLAGYLPLMDRCAMKLAESLLARTVGAVRAAGAGKVGTASGAGDRLPPSRVDIHRELGRMTLQVVGSCAYGVDFATLDDDGGKGKGDVQRGVEEQR